MFFLKQKTADEISAVLVGSEMGIGDSNRSDTETANALLCHLPAFGGGHSFPFFHRWWSAHWWSAPAMHSHWWAAPTVHTHWWTTHHRTTHGGATQKPGHHGPDYPGISQGSLDFDG